MLQNITDWSQTIYLFVFTFIYIFDKYKERELSKSLNILKEDLEKTNTNKKETKEEKETVDYIYYCLSNLHLVKKFVKQSVDLNQYHWSTWEDKNKGTVIHLNYRINAVASIDLYPNNYLVYNHTHKDFSCLTPQELSVEIHQDVKDYKQWMIT